jgi:serine/threonine protein kinase/Flp pilus assembly protein TadD
MASQDQSVEQLFGEALDRKPEERQAFLDRECADAPEIKQRVKELLLANDRAASFLEKPILIFGSDGSDSIPVASDIHSSHSNSRAFDSTSIGRFTPGQTIAERFTVVRFIARGGMGEVYEVEDQFLQGVHVALKMILPHIAEDAGSSHRFEQEVLLARKVTHPNLCPIYDISHCQEPPPPFLFLTMKLLSGETLASRLKISPPIPRGEVALIFRQMIGGLAALHDGGVIHRDIKPTNVMLDRSGSELCLSIMDFGLARLYDSQTTALTRGLIAGTPGYIAPELLRGDCPSQATDIFALGVVFQQVLTGEHPNPEVQGLSAKPSPALDAADAPPAFVQSVRKFLSDDPKRRRLAFEQIRSIFESGDSLTAWTIINPSNDTPDRILTRRNFVIGSALTACAAAGGLFWKRGRIDDLFHPIPLKRFVALINWPQDSDSKIKPMLNGVVDAIANELSRAEAFDHNLYVASDVENKEVKTPSELNEVRDSLGANLVLATSGAKQDDTLHVFLRLLDPSSTRILRETQISSPLSEQISLPQRAVRAAEQLLDVKEYQQGKRGSDHGSQSPAAFAAFQEAEAFRKQENGKGLEASIEKYKDAIDLDPHYAIAHAQLAFAYLRQYAVSRDPAAIDLARGNSEAAVALEPNLVEAHLALGSVFQETGDETAALREIAKALSLDPSNPRTLIYQAQIYSRLNRWEDAEKTLRRVLRERPNYWLPYNELGMNYYAQGKYPEALDSFRAASLANPKNALALSNAGSIYQLLGDYDNARDRLNRSLALAPTDGAFANLASVLRAQGKYPEAVEKALKATDLNPTEPRNWLEVGDSYSFFRGHSSEAKAAYLRAAQEQQEHLRTDATNGAGWMQLALYRAKSGSPASAIPLMKKAEYFKAGDIESQLAKARILVLLGDHDAALDAIEVCLKMGATPSQIDSTPDLESLRSDPRFQKMATSSVSQTETN